MLYKKNNMVTKQRIFSFFVLAALFVVSYSIGAESIVSADEADEFLKEFEKLIEGIDAIGIFLHNIAIALPMFIPGFGIAWGLFAAWQTGFAFAVLETTSPILSGIPPLTILLLSPFGLMELAAYSLAMSRSFLLIHKIIKKKSIRKDYLVVGMEAGIVIVLLLAGGLLEFYMIEKFSGGIV